MEFNLADLFEIVSDRVPRRVALVAGATRLTYDQLDRTPAGKPDYRWAKAQALAEVPTFAEVPTLAGIEKESNG